MHKIELIYLAGINVLAFLMFGIDKFKAIKHLWRIPEATLLAVALFGGSIGSIAGMLVFHHKTHKPGVWIPIVAILVFQIALLGNMKIVSC